MNLYTFDQDLYQIEDSSILNFEPLLPETGSSSSISVSYSVALNYGLNLIVNMMYFNTFLILFSDGGSDGVYPEFEISWLLMIRNQMKSQYQTCLFAICISLNVILRK